MNKEIEYNKKKHLQLLTLAERFKSLGKSLSKEKKEDFLELARYEAAIEEHIYWKSRRQFALLMENFINGRINGETFSEDFSRLSRQLNNTYKEFIVELGSEKLKDFQLDLRSRGFGSLISFLRAECDSFEEDYTNKEFEDSIKDSFLKLQKALEEEEND